MSRRVAKLNDGMHARDLGGGRSPASGAEGVPVPTTVAVASFRRSELLRSCLDAILLEIDEADGGGVVVARPEALGDLDELREAYPSVTLIGAPEDADVPRLRGLALAQVDHGNAFLTEDHCRLVPGSLAEVRDRLRDGADMVGGPMGNASDQRVLDWGAYFAEYGFFGPRAAAAATVPSPTGANVAYAAHLVPDVARACLDGSWENVIHDALRRAHVRISFSRQVEVRQAAHYRWGAFCRDRFEHGRAYARERVGRGGVPARLLHALKTPLLAPVLLLRVWRSAGAEWPGTFVRALPFTTSFLSAWAFGEFVGSFGRSSAETDDKAPAFPDLARFLAERRAADYPAVSTESRLTVVIPSVNGWHDLGGCLDALMSQQGDVDLEVLVADRVGNAVRSMLAGYPSVRLVAADSGTTIPELRAMAFREATGDVVGVIEDHVIVPPNWTLRMLEAHAAGSLVVGGSVDNAARERLVEWASFLCEYSHCLAPPVGSAEWLTGNNVTYRRQLLDEYRDVIEEGGWENRLHDAFKRDGIPLMSKPEIEVGHKKHFGLAEYFSQRYLYSRSYAGKIVEGKGWIERLFRVAVSFALPPVLAWRITSNIWRSGRYRRKLVASLPMIGIFVLGWAFGETVGAALGSGDALARVR